MFKQIFNLLSIINDRGNERNAELWGALFGRTIDSHQNFLEKTKADAKSLIVEDLSNVSFRRMPQLKENPNPRARVAFMIQNPFHYFIHKNVYRHLAQDAEFVIEAFSIRKNMEEWFPLLQKFVDFLQNEKVNFRIFSSSLQDNPFESTLGETFFRQYHTLISHTFFSSMRLPCVAEKNKVRLMYGQSKDIYDFGPWLKDFDLALNYGVYSQKYSEFFVKSEIVGNPKFDDWFKKTIDQSAIDKISRQIDPQKKTVLYLPTHGNLSSLEWVAKVIPELLRYYNIILKPHQNTLYYESFRGSLLAEFKKLGAIMTDDFTDILPLLKIADTVLLDNSGAIFDAVLAEKPVVLIDFIDTKFLRETQWKEIKKRAPSSWIRPLTYENSMEQRIKREPKLQPGPVVKKPEEIGAAIENSLLHIRQFVPAQKRLQRMLFALNDGRAGERAAELIRKISKEPRPLKTFWALSAEAEFLRIQTYKDSYKNLLQSLLQNDYINLDPLHEQLAPFMRSMHMPALSVIIPTYNRAHYLKRACEAFTRQKGITPMEFEVIVVDDASTDDTSVITKNILQENTAAFRYVRLGKNSGPAVARNVGIILARGELVCFTDDDAEAPDDWLLTINEEMQKNPELAGIGGWKAPDVKSQNAYGLFKWLQDGKFGLLDHASKDAGFWAVAGDTASICYRKSVLKKIGGFNPDFRLPESPAFEDWDLKIRLLRKKYAIGYTPKLFVRHHHPYSLRAFIKRYLIRGWGFFLLSRLHPDVGPYYRRTILRALNIITADFIWIAEANVPFFMKVKFILLAVIKGFTTWFAKYWGALTLYSLRVIKSSVKI